MIIQSLRVWWQRQTGEEDTPFDGDAPAFFVSLVTHLAILITLGFIPQVIKGPPIELVVTAAPTEEELPQELKLPEEVYFNEQEEMEIGANSVLGTEMALSEAPVISEQSVVPSHSDLTPTESFATIEINNAIEMATGLHYSENKVVRGAVGTGTTGASGAVDRITHEILLSLEERKTLVVWLFDQTASLVPQRKTIHDRFERIYRELGVLEAAENEAFKRHADRPLLSSVVSFGSQVNLLTKKPTDDVAELKEAIAGMPNDTSGDEQVFTAIEMAANHFANYRYTTDERPEPERNVMLVVFTDEVGSDQSKLDTTVRLLRRYAMPVYVVGVPAPFGRKDAKMKWVAPDPQFDQTPQWGTVEQGPESLYPERVKLAFSGSNRDDEAIDSGFGPFALTRLCYESGGIYFAVHPNRDVRRSVSRTDTEAFSAHLKHFFDPEVMRKYRPDYVSAAEYQKRVSQSKARLALVQAAQMSQVLPMQNPQLRFVKSDEAEFGQALTTAQQAAARAEPEINMLFAALKEGEGDREKETTPRWQAGYDLAMGRVLAVKARTESYNAMLAAAKRGLRFKNEKNNTWVLEPADEISVGSQLAKVAERAKFFLERVVKDHPDTPWALLAEQELKDPIGWKWAEDFTPTTTTRPGMGNGNANPAAQNDKKMMLAKPKPVMPLPKL